MAEKIHLSPFHFQWLFTEWAPDSPKNFSQYTSIQYAKNILKVSHEPVESGIAPLQLADKNYGTVSRFYSKCTADKGLTPFIQQKMFTQMPCRKVYGMDTSLSPFLASQMN